MCKAHSPPAAGCVSNMIPLCRSAVHSGAFFCSIGIGIFQLYHNTVLPIEQIRILPQQDSPPAAGCVSNMIPLRRSAIHSGAFFCSIGIGTFQLYHNTVFPIEQKSDAKTNEFPSVLHHFFILIISNLCYYLCLSSSTCLVQI